MTPIPEKTPDTTFGGGNRLLRVDKSIEAILRQDRRIVSMRNFWERRDQAVKEAVKERIALERKSNDVRVKRSADETEGLIARSDKSRTPVGRLVGDMLCSLGRQRENKLTSIYFIGCGAWVKIGRSCNPLTRLSDLQISHPEDLDFLGSFRGFICDETFLHQRLVSDFGVKRGRGEWFLEHPAITEVISILCDETQKPKRQRTMRRQVHTLQPRNA